MDNAGKYTCPVSSQAPRPYSLVEVWRGAAPTGHARVPAYKNDSQVPTRRMANSSGTSSQSTKQRRRLPPDIVSSNSSDDDRPSQRPKRPRTTTVAEDLFENDSNVEVVSQAAHHKERSLGTQSAPKANKRASQVFDGDDADIEEDYEDHHGPGEEEDDDDAIAYSPTEDQDLVDIEPSQLRAKLCHEVICCAFTCRIAHLALFIVTASRAQKRTKPVS